MVLQIMSAFLAALLVGVVFGKRYVPWLKKKGFIQPIKDKVEEIYSADEAKTADSHGETSN